MDYAVPCIRGRIKNRTVEVSVPGSKSLTARALFISALAEGTSVLHGAGLSDDCLTFINCLQSLGIAVSVSGTDVTVEGCGGKLPVSSGEVYVGSAGTAARFITALVAFSGGTFTVRASEQMTRRPVGPLLSALAGAGARFDFLGEQGCFPFVVHGTASPERCMSVDIGSSSQYLSALLMVGACRGTEVSVSGSHGMKYVDMTVKMMRDFGAEVTCGGSFVAGGGYRAREYAIEPDISAACYFYAVNRVLGTDIRVRGVQNATLQGDMRFIELMRGGFDGGRADMSAFSDQALTMAAIAPYFSKPTQICGISHIRGQECDRINAIKVNLDALGVPCTAAEDGVTISPAAPRPARIRTFGDHRVAMSFAVTGLRCEGVVIEHAEVCSKTFPDYFGVLGGLVAELTK